MTKVMSDFISTWVNPHLGEIIMMKKSIFAVAVASALTLGAAQAETVLYGSIRYDYENVKQGTTNRDNLSNLSDAGSRIGIKGSEDLGNGNAVIYNLEFGFDGMTQDEGKGGKTRLAILGLTGNWGTFTAGRQHNPFKVTVVDDAIVDDFNGSSVISSASQRAMTTALKGSGLGSKINDAEFSRVGKVMAYTTPDLAGFQASLALMMDKDNYPANDEKDVDLWTVNAKYAYDLGANGTILTKAGYIQGKVSGDKNKSKAWGLFLGYSQDAFAVSANFAKGDYDKKNNSPKNKSQGWDLGASYSFGPNYFSTIRATYGESQVKNDGDKDKVKSWAVGFEQKLSTRTRAWVEYGKEDIKYHTEGSDKYKTDVISVGMRHDF